MTRVTCAITLAGVGLVVVMTAIGALLPSTEPPILGAIENSVTSFEHDHPDWAVRRNDRRDATPISFGHAKHLDRNLLGAPPGGLRCVDCHEPEGSGRHMKPVSFDAHCRECHAANLGNINVAEGVIPAEMTPHGSVAAIAGALDRKLGEWARTQPERFAIMPDGEPGVPAGESAAEPQPADDAPSKGRRRSSDRGKPKAEVPIFRSTEERDAWFALQRSAALEVLASTSRCGYCHTNIVEPGATGQHFEVPPPNIPSRWLPRAQFSHHSHEMLRCNECHNAIDSTETSHILLPAISSCRECHASAVNGSGGAPHGCVLCHTYHQDPPPSQGLRVIDDLRRKR